MGFCFLKSNKERMEAFGAFAGLVGLTPGPSPEERGDVVCNGCASGSQKREHREAIHLNYLGVPLRVGLSAVTLSLSKGRYPSRVWETKGESQKRNP